MNVYVPSEAIVRETRRFLDWRFLAALAALVLVGFLVYAGFRNYAIREQEAAQKDALITELSERAAQINELERDIARLSDRAAQDRRESSRERDRLLRQQERMIRLLRANGIDPSTNARSTSASSSSDAPAPATTSSTDTGRSRPRSTSSPRQEQPTGPGELPGPPDGLDLLPDLPVLPPLL